MNSHHSSEFCCPPLPHIPGSALACAVTNSHPFPQRISRYTSVSLLNPHVHGILVLSLVTMMQTVWIRIHDAAHRYGDGVVCRDRQPEGPHIRYSLAYLEQSRRTVVSRGQRNPTLVRIEGCANRIGLPDSGGVRYGIPLFLPYDPTSTSSPLVAQHAQRIAPENHATLASPFPRYLQ